MELQDKIDRGLPLLDVAIPKYLALQKLTYGQADAVFMQMFDGLGGPLVYHLIEAWHGKKKAFCEFYLNLDHRCDRKVLIYFGIEVEPDTLPDSANGSTEEESMQYLKERYLAIRDAEDRFDVFPFETHMLHKWLLFAYNTCLDELTEWGMGDLLRKSKVNHYGNGKNWGKFYEYLLKHGCDDERRELVRRAALKR